ncbi:MAG: hypothetical protein ABI743_11650 [bacterium]
MHSTVLRALLAFSLLVLCAAAGASDPAPRSWDEWHHADRDTLKRCFDLVARNQGAVEDAYYSFTLEYRRVPHSIQELQESGHLTVPLVSPYTGEAPHYPDAESINGLIHEGTARPGDIWFRPKGDEGEVGIAGLYMDPNEPITTKWMRSDIVQYINEADRLVMFPPLADPRDKRMRIAMEHVVGAIDGYIIRFGQSPPTWEDLAAGDTRIDAANPYAAGQSISEGTGPGQFQYTPIDAKTYQIAGFGPEGPVYYFANDVTHWSVTFDPAEQQLHYEIVGVDQLQSLVENPDESMSPQPHRVLNKYIYMDWLDHMVDTNGVRVWADTHAACAECGSTEAMWNTPAADGTMTCRDTITGNTIPNCCCEEMDRMAAEQEAATAAHPM